METNALVIDLEYWFSPELLRGHIPECKCDQVADSLMPILTLLDKYKVRATFAVLGTVADKHPDLIYEIYNNGHEIASHGWSHKTLHELGKNAFENEIIQSISILRSITGEKPLGFRAPSFSIDRSTSWAFEILERYGFTYDASIFPIKNFLYGLQDAPLYIYRPSKEDICKNDPHGKIIEFPMTVLEIGVRVPIAGGFYLRALPFWLLKYGIKKVNKNRPAIIYIHPWETYLKTPRGELPFSSAIITYYGIKSSLNKLEGLIKAFKFASIRDILVDR